jgi:hypothetical protein
MVHEAFFLDQLGCSPISTRILQNWNHYITKIFVKKRAKGMRLTEKVPVCIGGLMLASGLRHVKIPILFKK